MSCLVPVASEVMGFGQIFFCIGEMLFGDIVLSSLVFVLVVAFFLWRLHLPIQVSYPISVLLLFALGSVTYGVGEVFTKLLWVWVISLAVIFVMGVLSWARR